MFMEQRNRRSPYNSENEYTENQDRYNRNRDYSDRSNSGNNYDDENDYRNRQDSYGSNYNQGRRGNSDWDAGRSGYGGSYNAGGANENDYYGRGNQREDYDRGFNGGPGSYGGNFNRSAGNRDYDRNYGSMGNYRSGNDYESSGWNESNEPGRNWGNQQSNNWRNRSQNDEQDRNWWNRSKDEVSSWFGDSDAQRRRNMDQRTGQNRGKGPKDYQRSEERIREDVSDRLSDDDEIDASDIEVKVSGSEVILSGTVESREIKRRAEDIAESVSGVTNVQNQLRIGNQSSMGSANMSSKSKSMSGSSLKTEGTQQVK